MKSIRLVLCALPLALTGCSTLSSVDWSMANPMNWTMANPLNWFGSSTKVTEEGVGNLTAATPFTEQAISDALGSDYRVRSGMRLDNGNMLKYFEAVKIDHVAMTINGESGRISRIDVTDSDIPASDGTKIGTPFSDIYSRAFNNCQKSSDNVLEIECRAKDSQHINYTFIGRWGGPPQLMPSDDTLKAWKVSKIVWRR